MIPVRRRWSSPAIGAALAMAGVALLVWAAVRHVSDDRSSPGAGPGAPSTSASPNGVASQRSLSDFPDVGITITDVGGTGQAWCLLAARTDAEHQRGLMQVRDPTLGGRDGMLFSFANDEVGAFWMRNTPMPLEIAYLDRRGRLVSTSDMVPCADEPNCPGYPPRAPYRYAIEVPKAAGGLRRLGIVPSAVMRVSPSCAAASPAR